jgi:hypothetical protein
MWSEIEILQHKNWRLQLKGLAKPGKTCVFTGTGMDLARQEAMGWVVRQLWNLTERFIQSNPGPLVGYPDPLLTLALL